MLRSPDTIPTEFPKLANHSVRFLPSCWLDGRFSRTPHLYNYKRTKKQGLLHNMDSFLAREEGKNDEQLATQAPAIALRISWWGYWLGGSGTLDWHSSLGVSHLTIWLIWNQRGFSFSVLCWAKLLASAVVKLWGHQWLCKPQTITVQKETAKLKSPCGHIFLENLYLRAMASRNTVRHIRRPRFFHLPDIVDVLTKEIKNTVWPTSEFFNVFSIVELVATSHCSFQSKWGSFQRLCIFQISAYEITFCVISLWFSRSHCPLFWVENYFAVWVGCALFTKKKQPQGMNKLSQAALGKRAKSGKAQSYKVLFVNAHIHGS